MPRHGVQGIHRDGKDLGFHSTLYDSGASRDYLNLSQIHLLHREVGRAQIQAIVTDVLQYAIEPGPRRNQA